jgi:alpha-tubulin suppressor-like RCC1 family protein
LKEVSCWGSIWDGLDQVPKGDNFSQLSVSTISNCVLDTAGKVICWGFGSKNLKQPPVIKRPTYFAQTNSGTCFVMNDQIFCAGSEDLSLGRNVKGIKYLTGRYHSLCLIDELGPLCVTHNPFLQMPQGSQNATQLSIGADHLCGILDEGKVECWGERPLEMDSTVTGLRGVKKITSGYRHSCALTDKNVLRCWGVDAVNPNFSSDQKVVDIASGSNFSCALLENDAIKCWMLEGYEDRDIVHPPAFVIDAKGLISGDQFACVYSDSEINCWGSKNDDIQLPPKVAGKIKSISAGNSHACFEDEEKIKCWGSNRQGNYLFFQE